MTGIQAPRRRDTWRRFLFAQTTKNRAQTVEAKILFSSSTNWQKKNLKENGTSKVIGQPKVYFKRTMKCDYRSDSLVNNKRFNFGTSSSSSKQTRRKLKENLPTTVGSKSTNTALGTCFPAPVSLKKVLKESSPPPMVLSLGIWPSGWIPCSKQYSSQQPFPIWTPAWPTWTEIHSRWNTILKHNFSSFVFFKPE